MSSYIQTEIIMHLKKGAVLEGGKYTIEKLLGQGGFGITYLAIQSGLNRKVAIKEFFMKDLCNRDAETSHVSVPSVGSRELVERFKSKFMKEAQMISEYRHPNIVNIYDVFEENGTAYYVMEYHDGGSLSSLDLPLSVDEASGYIRQIASALSVLHENKTMHLDIKPSNVLLDKKGNAVLIDFGVSKHYDQAGHQTSSTPVGISHGYAPGEQYQQNVLSFSPATDIYALGATFYKLLTGLTPPHQSEVNENGLPPFPSFVPYGIISLIRKSMQSKRKDRPQSIEEFLGLLDAALAVPVPAEDPDESTEIEIVEAVAVDDSEPVPTPSHESRQSPKKPSRKWLWWLLALLVAITCAAAVLFMGNDDKSAVSSENSVEHPTSPLHELDKEKYDSLLTAASKLPLNDLASYDEAIGLYEQAKEYEVRYGNTEYMSLFSRDSQQKIADLKDARGQLKASMSEADQANSDARAYAYLMEMGAEYEEKDEYLEQAREKYSEAEKIEENWSKTKYSDMFVQKAASAVERVEKKILELEERDTKFNNDQKDYTKKIREANSKSRNDESSLKAAKKLYEDAAKYEKKYENTEYASSFNAGAATLAKNMQSLIDNLNTKTTPAPSVQTKNSSDIYYSNGVLYVKGIEYPMVYVSGDTFQMGSTDSDAYNNEKNVHSVTLNSYRIGKYEVTQKLWEAVMGSNPSYFKGPKRPVENVSWKDCDDFIKELDSLTGQNFRLPTEAEWEYAARGGKNKNSYKYSGSNDLADVAWYGDNSSSETHDVGQKSPNSLGLYDMSGNVWEWCYDWYGAYPSSSQINPKGPSSGSSRVLRGGSWYGYAGGCRVSYRNFSTPSDRGSNVGFRLCL